MNTILHTVHIHAPAARVYEALTTQRGLSGWWSTRVDVTPGEGGVVRFTFVGDFNPEMKQTRLEPLAPGRMGLCRRPRELARQHVQLFALRPRR
jgi:hypothetical protein